MSKLGQTKLTTGVLATFVKKNSTTKVIEIEDDDLDVSIGKVTSAKKKPTQWVSSSFDDFADFLPSKTPCSQQNSDKSVTSKKRARDESHPEPVHRLGTSVKGLGRKLKKVCNDDLWADKHRPSNKGELAVHKKKVEDIESWLSDRTRTSYKHNAPILLLTGPAGVGKTATIQVLCKELSVEVQEWVNPVQNSHSSEQLMPSSSSSFDKSRVDVGYSESQLTQFTNFLLRANKYSSLQIGDIHSSSRKIIFIEELPNIFFKDSHLFHDILRKYRQVGRCPLVFIISDTSSGESNERLLFPADLQDELRMENISFNPVAPTMMIKVLGRIANAENREGSISSNPSSVVIESIAMSSAGDVRSAINALQFACRQDTFDLRRKCSSKRPAMKKSSTGTGRRLKYSLSQKQESVPETETSIGARDTSCFLFHAIGKVLYSKRGDPKDYPEHCTLPQHLAAKNRDPLLLNPEEVVEKSHISGNYFASFLHQNYVEFYNRIDDIDCAAQYMSDADFFTADWASRSATEQYAASIATRGVIFCNSEMGRHDSKRTGLGWKPIHKSQWFTVNKQSLRNRDTALSLFKGYHWEPKVLCSEILPHINMINITLHSPGQIAFVQEMNRFSKFGTSNRQLEKLDETDVMRGEDQQVSDPVQQIAAAQEGEEGVTLSQNKVKVPEEEDAPVIEDYDDEEYEDLFLSDDSFT